MKKVCILLAFVASLSSCGNDDDTPQHQEENTLFNVPDWLVGSWIYGEYPDPNFDLYKLHFSNDEICYINTDSESECYSEHEYDNIQVIEEEEFTTESVIAKYKNYRVTISVDSITTILWFSRLDDTQIYDGKRGGIYVKE